MQEDATRILGCETLTVFEFQSSLDAIAVILFFVCFFFFGSVIAALMKFFQIIISFAPYFYVLGGFRQDMLAVGLVFSQPGFIALLSSKLHGETRPQLLKGSMPLAFESQLMQGNGYETQETSKGLTKEDTLMLSRASTLHNLLFYVHLLCLIDQT